MESKYKHLEFIQLTITRMAANSFFLKGWSVTLISALAVLAQKDSNPKFWVIGLLPALMFWGLDAYFLRQERLFRALYNAVRKKSEEEIDFSLDTTPHQGEVDDWLSTAWSPTLRYFHASILVAIVCVAIFITKSTTSVTP